MAKTTKKNTKPVKVQKGKAKGPRSKKFAVLFLLVGLFLVADLIAYVIKKANEAKEVSVQKIQDITGTTTTAGAFKAWDIMAYAGGLALSDQSASRILFLDIQGNKTGEISGKSAGAPVFKEPSCMTTDSTGNLYIMDTWNALIRGFDPKGKPISRIDLGNRGFYGPRGLAWSNNSFLIADTGSHRLVKVDQGGALVGSWGTRGSSKGQFDNPYQVVADAQGNAYVVDRDNDRIQVLDAQGHYLREIGLGVAPAAEAIDPMKKLLYVSSLEGKFVKVFDLNGKYVGLLVEAGQKGQSIPDINGLTLLPNGDLALLQSGSHILVEHILPPPSN
jgi:hypothetical protein